MFTQHGREMTPARANRASQSSRRMADPQPLVKLLVDRRPTNMRVGKRGLPATTPMS